MAKLHLFRHLAADRLGITALEYGIIAAFFAVTLMTIFGNFGKSLTSLYNGITSGI